MDDDLDEIIISMNECVVLWTWSRMMEMTLALDDLGIYIWDEFLEEHRN